MTENSRHCIFALQKQFKRLEKSRLLYEQATPRSVNIEPASLGFWKQNKQLEYPEKVILQKFGLMLFRIGNYVPPDSKI